MVFSPLFAWPPNPQDAILALTKRWVTVSRNVLFLVMAFLVFQYLVPDEGVMRTAAGDAVR